MKLNNKLNNIYSLYKDAAKNKSISDILQSFSQLAKSEIDVNDESYNINKEFTYSSYIFDECSAEEKQNFINDQLQLIECMVAQSIKSRQGDVWNWYDIYNLLHDQLYAATDKANRKAVFSTSSFQRPIGDPAYTMWNGLQIIDIDIKDAGLAASLKPLLFNSLKKYNWFLGICTSASQKSLHVWTKIQPITIDLEQRRIEYICNYRHKYSYIYIILLQYADQFGYSKEDIIKQYLDNSMAKPQQGIFISSDNSSIMNTNFKDLRLDVNFEPALSSGIESINWITHPDLKEIFKKLEWFANDEVNDAVNIDNLSNIDERNINKNKRIHYKHSQRWQIANTLAALYGEANALELIKDICSGTPYNELRGDIRTAIMHNKPISLWAVNTLNQNHGFNIKLSEEIYNKEFEIIKNKIDSESDNSVDPIKILNENTNKTILHLRYDQYLSDIKDEILSNLANITLLEAGAGYGKTEMIKSLKERTLLILPFTSTIKAKVESSEVTKDWLYYYGNKRPTFQELMGTKNMSMTIDKFSRLNLMELDQANFKYIVIDESHLLYTSSYRGVMSPTIQRLANCTNTKVIMMTGTPTGETLFFPNIKHLKVVKEDHRKKTLDIYLCDKRMDKIVEMADRMAQDIFDGKKILYPSNDGNLFYEQMIGLIKDRFKKICENNKVTPREIKSFYYKKSNYGDESMDEIDVNKSIGPNDIICCSNYLSVGVDICDRYTFSIYFSKPWISQDIEQFANRIRNNDLYIKLFLEKSMADGSLIDYKVTKQLDLDFDMADMLFIRDMIQVCNDMLERNEEESKYNPMVTSLLSANTFLKYDENDCKYYIDETTYKLKLFEERYSQYSKQLNVIVQNMRYYGYDVLTHNMPSRFSEEEVESAETIFKAYRHSHYNEQTNKTFNFLHHINDGNIETYKEIMKGNYNIFKGDEYKEIREDNNIYVKDIETVLKNMPIYMKLYTFYDCDTIIDIYDYCLNKKTNKINYSQLDRICRFVTIENNRRKNKIDFPVYKFILDAQKFAVENEYIDKTKLKMWIATYAAKIANGIKNLVIEDNTLFETIFELTEEIFNIIIINKGTKNGIVHIKPFELLWERKYDLFDQFGGSIYTKEFFIETLVNNINPTASINEDYINEKEIPLTDKLNLDDVKNILPSIVHKSYDYYTYSIEDGSNDKFVEKQKNTKHEYFVDTRGTLIEQVINDVQNKPDNTDLFGSSI